jgi:predicted CXXCH cytochrome family protein
MKEHTVSKRISPSRMPLPVVCSWSISALLIIIACLPNSVAAPVMLNQVQEQTAKNGDSEWANPELDCRTDTLVLAYTTDTNGYLESCGCTSRQAGGLARRATVLEGLRQKTIQRGDGWLLVDGGNLADTPARSDAVLGSMRLMGYGAIVAGWQEERLGDAFLRLSDAYQVPLLRQPVTQKNAPGFQSARTVRFFRSGNRSVAIMGISADSWQTSRARLLAQASKARKQATLVIGIIGMRSEEKQALSKDTELLKMFDVVIGLSASAKNDTPPITTTFLPPTAKGEIGVASLLFQSRTPNTPTLLSHRSVPVSDTILPNPHVADLVSAFFQREAEQLNRMSSAPAVDWQQIGYEAPERCGSCHGSAYQAWQRSKHAIAARTLQTKNRLVAQCLTCHSEVFRRTNRFKPDIEAAWHGVACTTCHGDGILHSAVRTRPSVVRNPGEAFCRKCHDAANDPHFEYRSYMKKIRHW